MARSMVTIESCKKVAAAGVVLKKMKKHEGLDGLGWSFDLHFKGKNVGSVGHDGNGGPVRVDIEDDQLAQIVTALKAVDYPLDLDVGNGFTLDAPTTDYGYAELVLPEIADELDNLKRFKRAAAKRMLIALVGGEEGSYIIANCPYTPENAAMARAHYGDKLNYILNELLVGL